jgi:hypothetical protein
MKTMVEMDPMLVTSKPKDKFQKTPWVKTTSSILHSRTTIRTIFTLKEDFLLHQGSEIQIGTISEMCSEKSSILAVSTLTLVSRRAMG